MTFLGRPRDPCAWRCAAGQRTAPRNSHSPRKLSLSSPPSKLVSKGRSRHGGQRWPVLARLPDVSLPAAQNANPSKRANAAGFVEYRFDPPQAQPTKTQAHALRRDKPRKYRRTGRPSPVLPNTNPFAIPAITLRDRLAPLIRFAVMFTLFTVLGTLLLRGLRREPSDSGAAHPPLTRDPLPIRQQLTTEPTGTEPQPSTETAFRLVEPPKPNAPTATGPAGIPRGATKPPVEQTGSAIGPPQIVELPQLLPQVQTSSSPTHSAAESVRLPRASGPAPMARLTGDVLPQRQAHHDDDQSRLY